MQLEIAPMTTRDSLEKPGEAIIEDIHLVDGPPGFYNAAAWKWKDVTYLLGRQVEKAGGEGEPDAGLLVLLTLNSDGSVASTREVWRPQENQPLLEDSRALVLPDGSLSVGLTYVVHEGDRVIPHPAILVIRPEDDVAESLCKPIEITHIRIEGESLEEAGKVPEGKNVTPLGENMYAFRPEGDKNNFRLQVFKYQEGKLEGEAEHVQYIQFPENIPWATWRMGTTMPPIWISEREAIFPVHGITKEHDIYVYSIGFAKLRKADDGTLSITDVRRKPIIGPDNFPPPEDGSSAELHNNRRVTYCCGGVPVFDKDKTLTHIRFFINVGDKRTFEVLVAM